LRRWLSSRSSARRWHSENLVQATVLTFDAATGAGTVVTDSGEILAFDADAFTAGGLRLLRLGQRVRLSRSSTGTPTSVTIVTLPEPPDTEADRT
jgi:cold shock CspA family protein